MSLLNIYIFLPSVEAFPQQYVTLLLAMFGPS